MTFATISDDRQQLLLLSQLLLAAFPGSTIHQSRDPMRMAQHLSEQKVDAVFADADICSNMMHILERQRHCMRVCLLCRNGVQKHEDIQSMTYPVTQQKIQCALQTISHELREVV